MQAWAQPMPQPATQRCGEAVGAAQHNQFSQSPGQTELPKISLREIAMMGLTWGERPDVDKYVRAQADSMEAMFESLHRSRLATGVGMQSGDGFSASQPSDAPKHVQVNPGPNTADGITPHSQNQQNACFDYKLGELLRVSAQEARVANPERRRQCPPSFGQMEDLSTSAGEDAEPKALKPPPSSSLWCLDDDEVTADDEQPLSTSKPSSSTLFTSEEDLATADGEPAFDNFDNFDKPGYIVKNTFIESAEHEARIEKPVGLSPALFHTEPTDSWRRTVSQ